MKWFEKIGLKIDTHDGWNKDFIDGFNHLVYAVLGFAITYIAILPTNYSPKIVLGWLVILDLIFFFLMEVHQAYNMRHRTDYKFYEFWNWSQNRHQDYLLPFLAVAGLYYWIVL